MAKIALAQINPTVGDLIGNSKLIVEWTKKAQLTGAQLVVFPEMALTGYPIEDLALRPSFQAASKLALLNTAKSLDQAGLGEVQVIVGFLDSSTSVPTLGKPLGNPQNSAAILHRGAVIKTYAKQHLPNYGVFDEFRYFVKGEAECSHHYGDLTYSIAICEDIWQEGLQKLNPETDLLIVINGSPFEQDKDDVRLALVQKRAKDFNCAIAYVNLVGAQDELVFDGDSLVVSKTGTLITRAAQFKEQLLFFDTSFTPAEISPPLEPLAEIYQALTLGLKDYVKKNNFTAVLLGLSGGIDSALTAAIAHDALGPAAVFAVAMPSEYSSEHSIGDAAELAKNMGINLRQVPITPMVEAFRANLALTGLADENLQARARGVILMALSNQEGHLVLATGNKSEIATGYSTLYGDAVGGFAPIKDVPKTLVWELAKWRNTQAGKAFIPISSIEKPPSAELRPGQLDSDSLPDYQVLDKIIDAYVRRDQSAQALAAVSDPALAAEVITLIDKAEYKRRQYPPGTKISARAFGRDRRLPITSQWREASLEVSE
jgi:NAD+ synthase (glutamine-hydrolysing)